MCLVHPFTGRICTENIKMSLVQVWKCLNEHKTAGKCRLWLRRGTADLEVGSLLLQVQLSALLGTLGLDNAAGLHLAASRFPLPALFFSSAHMLLLQGLLGQQSPLLLLQDLLTASAKRCPCQCNKTWNGNTNMINVIATLTTCASFGAMTACEANLKLSGGLLLSNPMTCSCQITGSFAVRLSS